MMEMKADGLLKLFLSEFLKLFMEMRRRPVAEGPVVSYVKIMLMETRTRK